MPYKNVSIPLLCCLLASCASTPATAPAQDAARLQIHVVSLSAGIEWRVDPRFGLIVRAQDYDGKNNELMWPMSQNEAAKIERAMGCMKTVVANQRINTEKNFSNPSFPRQEVERCTQAERLTAPLIRALPDADEYLLMVTYAATLDSSGPAPLNSWSSGDDTLNATLPVKKPDLDSPTLHDDTVRCREEASRGGIARKIEVRGADARSGSVSIEPFVERLAACLQRSGYTIGP